MNPQDVIRALFGGIGGVNGIKPYNEEIPTNIMTGKPFLQPSPVASSANLNGAVNSTPKNQPMGPITPLAIARQQNTQIPSAINNQPQFDTRAQLDAYTGPNYAGMNRNQDEGIQDYVKRLISQPTGAGELSDKFMNAWSATNQTYAKNNEEPVAAKATGGNGSGIKTDGPMAMEGFNGFISRENTPLRTAATTTQPPVSAPVVYEGGTVANRGINNASVLRDRDREQLALVKAFLPNGGTRNPLSNEGMIPSGQNRQIPDMSFENFLITLQDRFNRGM